MLVGCGTVIAGEDATDTLHSPAQLQQVVVEAHTRFEDLQEGKNADYIPILAKVPSELFGVVIALRDGTTFVAGDVDYIFAIESVVAIAGGILLLLASSD